MSWCFAVAAFTFATIFLVAFWRYLPYWRTVLLPLTGRQLEIAVAGIWVPLAFAVVYGMAWWTTQRATAHARAWAIAASVLTILIALPPLVLWWVRRPTKFPVSMLGWLLVILAGGIQGVVVFSRRDTLSQMAGPNARPPRLPGDGTSHWVDTVVQFAGIAGVLAGLVWLGRWGEARGLPESMGLWFWVELLIADMIAVTGHELGHATVGRALGMRVRAFSVGPFQWAMRGGKWQFQFQPSNLLAWTGGSTGLVPTQLTDSPTREVWMIAAGPGASLCVGLAALSAMLTAKGRPWASQWELLGFVALISLVAFVINLVPIRPEADYSDGAQIYQLLTGSPWASVHRAFGAVSSSLVTPLRARDFDAQVLRRAAEVVPGGHRGFLLRMYSFMHYLDCGQIPEALQALAEAEKVYEESASDLPGELLAYFVYANAFLKPDAARARYWWDLMEAKKARQDCTEYWLARTAILWVENRREEALKAWEHGNALAQKLPEFGAYEFDRSRFLELRKQLDSPLCAT